MHAETTAPRTAVRPHAPSFLASLLAFLLRLFRKERQPGPTGGFKVPNTANGNNPDSTPTPATGGWPPPK